MQQREPLAGEPLVTARAIGPDDLAGVAPLEADTALAVWLVGTGTPLITADRFGPCVALRCGTQLMVVDTGNGCVYRLAQLGIAPFEITHIFFTHHHVDHNADLGFLLLDAWVTAGTESWSPPYVIGPPGTLHYVNGVLAAHHADIQARIPHGYDPRRLVVPVVEVGDGTAIPGWRWRATAFEVDHRPVEHAYGYRFETAELALVVSGDTKPCANLVRHARGADVLIHEALYPGYGIPEYHTSSKQVGRIAAQAGVRKLVLTHLIPGHLGDDVWLKDIEPDFDGEIAVGRDLMRII